MEEIIVKIDGKEHKVSVEEVSTGKLKVQFGGESFEVETKSEIEQQLHAELGKKQSSNEKEVKAPLPGIVFSIDVKVGSKVKKGDRLISLMAMKMENEIESPVEGVVKEIKVKKNDSVNKDDALIIFE